MNYRRLYESHYNCCILSNNDIHHIDGNHSNNCIENLKLVSLYEHFSIHLDQNDYGAAQAIAMRIDNFDSNMLSKLASKVQLNLLKDGKHNFQKMTKERRTEISLYVGNKTLSEKTGIHYINANSELSIINSRNAGKISKLKNAGFHDPNKTGGVFVKNTFWWYNTNTKERIRSKVSPGINWKRGMK